MKEYPYDPPRPEAVQDVNPDGAEQPELCTEDVARQAFVVEATEWARADCNRSIEQQLFLLGHEARSEQDPEKKLELESKLEHDRSVYDQKLKREVDCYMALDDIDPARAITEEAALRDEAAINVRFGRKDQELAEVAVLVAGIIGASNDRQFDGQVL